MQDSTKIAATVDAPPFHGLFENEGRVFSNWPLTRSTTPAVYAEPISYADVQAIVRDPGRFPTPVHPVGSMLSVTATFVNDGGTLVCLRKLDDVIGLERDPTGRQVVRVQAGCRLKKLNMWLQARGVEIPFQAEIGEASVGSVAVGDTKESSLDGAGYFSAHVVALTYVDDSGELRTLSDRQDGVAFHEFKCSFGLSGIVVECQLEVRPATLCRSDIFLAVSPSAEQLAADLLARREQCDAVARDRVSASAYELRRPALQGWARRAHARVVAAGLRCIPRRQAARDPARLRGCRGGGAAGARIFARRFRQ